MIPRMPPLAPLEKRGRSGGRAPTHEAKIDESDDLDLHPILDTECRLIICQITDVYTLENLAHFKMLVEDVRAKAEGAKVVSMLTGDFLSPYLLSSVDRGHGMMNALSKIPLDYLTWGNHEADIRHETVCRHVRKFPGTWINSNMLDHDAMDHQVEYEVIELSSPDKSHTRKVGMCAVLSDDPKLYAHFQKPGAFGGATITDPWEALTKYKDILENKEGCDVVVPLEHLYVPDDHKTCRNFDFPVILSGHDHHRVDEVVEGTRLIKPGMNADYAAIVELSWSDKDCNAKPKVVSRFVKCSDWPADPACAEENERAYDALIPLRKTELAKVPSSFEPLSSNNSRGSVCTMGMYICTLLRYSLNITRSNQRNHSVDAVLLMGGNIRGNADYDLGSYFSLEALEAEIKGDEIVGVVEMPGWVLAAGIQETHAGDPVPGWLQYDDGIEEEEDEDGNPIAVTVGDEPLDPDRVYRVATKISDLCNGQSKTWTKYYSEHMDLMPPKGSYVNIQFELMGYFARNLWRKLWIKIAKEVAKDVAKDPDASKQDMMDATVDPEKFLEVLDRSGDGAVTVEEIQYALRKHLGVSIDKREMTLAKFVHSFADLSGDGTITVDDLAMFCGEMDTDGDISELLSSMHVVPHRPKRRSVPGMITDAIKVAMSKVAE